MTRQAALGMLSRRAGALAALGAVAAPGAPASTYPAAAGNSFSSDAEGWSGIRADCTASGLGSLCTQSNGHSATKGNPPGSLEARTRVTANLLGTFRGESVLRSPSFTAAGSGSGTLIYDRQLDAESVVALSPAGAVAASLVDESTGEAHPLTSEDLSSTDEAFATRLAELPSHLVAGHRYHLELGVLTTTSVAREGLLGDLVVRFDNVALRVDDGLDSQPAGASASAGVRFTGTTLSSRTLRSLAAGVAYAAEVGRGAGGSVLPLARCTIIGTPRGDRIKGSPGNDVICGMGGNDRIDGGRGRDIVDGGNGDDRLQGSSGGDMLAGLRGSDRLDGGAGADRVGGGAGKDTLRGRVGKDRLNGGSAFDRLSGGAGADRLIARDGRRDLVHGGRGRDVGKNDNRKRVGRRRADTRRSLERLRR